ncbi:Mannose-1-phosphate guanylyltransferase 1 [Cymbomonas tetramitiformis]|uniref:mannose-1-phosphate guanylyltransferase n=1 Tax=Cymbomonas tetramitiformis TaxID=36881 RepID=A0AAE0L0B7_9CHLO|nr:Mannose-1-phosphate guanylyltransferase 1 [Cymbomonas tetramitiformis]KAK3267064.1 Mannose-1-phosphate guanylyltransferase 1 [Cymbomonas tetramitiformis]
MKALILVGGFGTRLRPLTLSVPKPLVDFANKPLILHQLEALKEAGVTEVVLALNYQPQVLLSYLEEYGLKLGMTISCSQETEPMGTAGPLALARDKLVDDAGSPFFVLNSDVICDYPLKEMLAYHQEKGAEGTIMVTKVEEPSKYGVVVIDEQTGHVDNFVEKPQGFVGNKVNAGIYLFNPSVLDYIELRPTSIEKEVFPLIAKDKKLFAMVSSGFWMDIGSPKDFMLGLGLYLGSLRKKGSALLSDAPECFGNVLIDPTATIGAGCRLGPNVTIGPGCVIEAGVRISKSAILHGVRVKSHACITGSIIGWKSVIGKWARVENMAVLGEDVKILDELYLNGGIVLPHKEIITDVMQPQIIM